MLAVPSFWLALVLVLLFAVNNPIFPTIGYAPLLDEGPWEWLRHLILPAVALSVSAAATIALQLKSAFVAEEGSDYLLAARAKGLTRPSLLFKHSFKNAAVPVVTILGFRVATLLGGTVIIETIFVLPGLGLLAQQSAVSQDVPVVLGIVTVTAVFIMLVNVLVDASYGYLNPKLQAYDRDRRRLHARGRPRAGMDRAPLGGTAPRSGAAPAGPQPGGDVRPRGRGARGGHGGLRAVARARTTRTTRTCCSGCRRRRPSTGSGPTTSAATS